MDKNPLTPDEFWKLFQEELELIQGDKEWLIARDGLDQDAIAFYSGYISFGYDLLESKPEIEKMLKGSWNKKYNFRHGADSIKGTRSEMFVEAACYTVGLKVDERVEDEKRQRYGEDLVVAAKKVSSKTRKHKAGGTVTLYPNDFVSAIWRIDISAFTDLERKLVTTIKYKPLAETFCSIDIKGRCKPRISDNTFVDLTIFAKRFPNSVQTIDLNEVLKKETNDDNNN